MCVLETEQFIPRGIHMVSAVLRCTHHVSGYARASCNVMKDPSYAYRYSTEQFISSVSDVSLKSSEGDDRR